MLLPQYLRRETPTRIRERSKCSISQLLRFFPRESFINGLDVLSFLTFVIYSQFASSSTLEGETKLCLAHEMRDDAELLLVR
jgi:hypothetical protein